MIKEIQKNTDFPLDQRDNEGTVIEPGAEPDTLALTTD
jgi:hypothetical protein